MVVSKDSKRKRKESPPPQPTAVESSPEMPKRTKVQAQRKFAQGQNAPTSSYSSVIAASSSSNTGPSTSSESREPPTEILPNKRPKTEDFLTFLCFRGTPALPAHLDFLNQGKAKEQEDTVKKSPPKPVKGGKKGKKGRPKGSSTKKVEPKASTSKQAIAEAATDVTETKVEEPDTIHSGKHEDKPEPAENNVIPFAVRKRAEVVPGGNRRIRPPTDQPSHTAEADKCNNSPETKRRSIRGGAKETQQSVEHESEEDDEFYSAKDDATKIDDSEKESNSVRKIDSKKLKTPILQERKSETPSKESETGRSRKGRPPSASIKGKDATVEDIKVELNSNDPAKAIQKVDEKPKAKEKTAVKRPRQKESPIFIPSPEPSGRMTRQRAFFEPVKVIHTEDVEEVKVVETDERNEDAINNTTDTIETQPVQKNTKRGKKVSNEALNIENKDKLNVFDFSSDDEQPLAKSMKLKKGSKGSPKKAVGRSAKLTKKGSPKKSNTEPKQEASITVAEEALEEKKGEIETNIVANGTKHDVEPEDKQLVTVKPKGRGRGRIAKKKPDEENEGEKEIAPPPSPIKQSPMRQIINKKSKSDISTVNGEDETDANISANVRLQRPSRKTKEAAAIYMGIIGHKLQLAEDEEDDLSLSSFPDRPNVKEMEKMENELKRNAATGVTTNTTVTATSNQKEPPNSIVLEQPTPVEKPPTTGRRGRPPKQPKQAPVKREIEGMLVKKGAISKLPTVVESVVASAKLKSDVSKADTEEDEDFLLNKELNETKRKLEKSFSDSDDEPLAIKANIKPNDKDSEHSDSRKLDSTPQSIGPPNQLMMLPITTKPVSTPPLMSTTPVTNASPVTAAALPMSSTTQIPSPFKTIEKKSPIPTSKILNVPATYAIPSSVTPPTANVNIAMNAAFNKSSTYLPPASPHYHTQHVRPPAHAFPTAKSPTAPPTPAANSTLPPHLQAPMPSQSPLKYPAAPTTYPPPIEAYPSPKINPNFLTPKFDRTSLPRTNNFPSPSPVKFDLTAMNKSGLTNSSLASKMTIPGAGTIATTAGTSANTSTIAGAATASADPLKDEIGSILTASLMPSKEESGKVFGIASVSLAQSSGPDNTKCTLGKCGSIHKPVLGPVVPTEGYIGDQLSSKERRKAKVNMTHEQIQKWLIECSSNPDEIQDDLDDDFDDNLRPNLFATTPPPTRDDKESTSFSSSSKATRDLGKSESAWSAKGPSLKATPVIATSSRKDEGKLMDTVNPMDMAAENDKTSGHAINLTQKSNAKTTSNANTRSETPTPPKATRAEKSDKKNTAVRKLKEEKMTNEVSTRDNKHGKQEKEKDTPTSSCTISKTTAAAAKQTQSQQSTAAQQPSSEVGSTPKPNRKKNTSNAAIHPTAEEKNAITTSVKSALNTLPISSSPVAAKTTKRTPVYNQKNQQKQIELKETTTTSHKKSAPFSYGAFSADNEKSIYSFDKDDDEAEGRKLQHSTPAFRRQSGRESQNEESAPNTPTSKASPGKKRAATTASTTADKTNKEVTGKSQNSSVSLTLSPSENCKLVKVSLDSEKPGVSSKANASKSTKGGKKQELINNDADSDSEGHTFYIPLQGVGTGGDGEGGIQGVAVKLGREGPDGPNQKVIMHATLVTKAQMGSNSKPLPESMNVADIVKTLIPSSQSITPALVSDVKSSAEDDTKRDARGSAACQTNSSEGGAANADKSSSSSLKNVPIGTVQPRFKGGADTSNQPSTSAAAANASSTASGAPLVRVNSNSSLFSGSAKSRMGGAGTGPSTHGANKKFKDDTPIKMSNNTAFPRHDDPTQMVEAPIFRPTEKEFADPIDFIERITPIAARFGICKIIPPTTFKPECRISDEMRFTAYNQYVHKMLHRWGPSAKELSAIKKYLATQSIVMNHPPWIGGMEVDLPRLYHTVQELGGLKEVIEKKKWARVAEEMCIPKLAQDRMTKLDDIYCKYLLPYDTLSPAERQKLFDEVEADWAKREARARRNADRFVNTESVSNEEDDVSSEDDEESEEEVDGVSMECIVKGRSMPLSQFYRIARNTMALWFKNTEPIVNEVEAEFWRHVAVRDSHVCVHSGSIDSSGWGYGFPSPGPKSKGSNYARHPWNLKVLTNNPGSVLRSLGPVMGVTVPTLHVGMLFSACCWYRDPHGLSWIEYLHTGASKLWYGIPDDQSANFRAALTSLIPTHCQNKTIWLPCDTVMVPPHMLTDRGVSLCRIEQKPGEFIVVFPRAYTSSLATGYVVSESVYFATTSWLDLAKDDFRDIHDSCEPAMFSLEQLLFALGYDQRVTSDTLQQMLPMLQEVYEKELAAREQLKAAGVTSTEKVPNEKGAKAKKQQPPHKSIESECDLCRANLYISMVKTEEGNVYCLQHALKNLNNGNIQAKQCKLIYAYNVEDIECLIKNLKDKIQQKRHAVVGKKSK